MMMYRVLIEGEEIASRVIIANTFFQRLKGLLKKKKIDDDEGLLIQPCNQVHTLGMKFDIDVIFISKLGEIIHIEANMSPGCVSPLISKSQMVLELKSGIVSDKSIVKGKRVAFDPVTI